MEPKNIAYHVVESEELQPRWTQAENDKKAEAAPVEPPTAPNDGGKQDAPEMVRVVPTLDIAPVSGEGDAKPNNVEVDAKASHDGVREQPTTPRVAERETLDVSGDKGRAREKSPTAEGELKTSPRTLAPAAPATDRPVPSLQKASSESELSAMPVGKGVPSAREEGGSRGSPAELGSSPPALSVAVNVVSSAPAPTAAAHPPLHTPRGHPPSMVAMRTGHVTRGPAVYNAAPMAATYIPMPVYRTHQPARPQEQRIPAPMGRYISPQEYHSTSTFTNYPYSSFPTVTYDTVAPWSTTTTTTTVLESAAEHRAEYAAAGEGAVMETTLSGNNDALIAYLHANVADLEQRNGQLRAMLVQRSKDNANPPSTAGQGRAQRDREESHSLLRIELAEREAELAELRGLLYDRQLARDAEVEGLNEKVQQMHRGAEKLSQRISMLTGENAKQALANDRMRGFALEGLNDAELEELLVQSRDCTERIQAAIAQRSTERARTKAEECSVCMDARIDTVCLPCGHLVLCTKCATRVATDGVGACPACRAPAQFKKVYHR